MADLEDKILEFGRNNGFEIMDGYILLPIGKTEFEDTNPYVKNYEIGYAISPHKDCIFAYTKDGFGLTISKGVAMPTKDKESFILAMKNNDEKIVNDPALIAEAYDHSLEKLGEDMVNHFVEREMSKFEQDIKESDAKRP
jgi:hypothetical protein